MTVNKRQKKRIDGYLFEAELYFDPDKIREVREYIEHLESIISDWQNATGKLHPTLTGVFEAKPKPDEGF